MPLPSPQNISFYHIIQVILGKISQYKLMRSSDCSQTLSLLWAIFSANQLIEEAKMGKNNSQWPNLPFIPKVSILMLSLLVDIMRRFDGSFYRFLAYFCSLKTSPSKKPINGVKSTDITIDKSRNLWFRLYTPNTTASAGFPVIFYFHGGGFTLFAPNSKPYDDLCYHLASELSAIVISVNYRLTPEHRYPSQYDDAFDALKFIDDTEIEGFSNYANLKQCFLAGDSAGGNLAHHVALRASEDKFSNIKLIGNILIQPFFGGEERTESELRLNKAPFLNTKRTDSAWKAFLPEGSSRDHPAANVFGPNSIDISEIKFPATIVFIGGYDPLKDWQKRYYEGLKKNEKEAYLVEYPNAPHTFYVFPQLLESALLIKDVREFMQNQLVSNI